MSKHAFYCYYITFYNLELSTFCNNLKSLIVSYFNKIIIIKKNYYHHHNQYH